MDKEVKAVIAIIALVACVLISLVGILTLKSYKAEKLYVNHGYEQVMVKGSSTYLWQKKKKVIVLIALIWLILIPASLSDKGYTYYHLNSTRIDNIIWGRKSLTKLF